DSSDAAKPPLQGAVSPSLFVYNNESLGYPAQKRIGKLSEPTPPPQPGEKKILLGGEKAVLPLIRYSHYRIGSNPVTYAVRCRYVNMAGTTHTPNSAFQAPDAVMFTV